MNPRVPLLVLASLSYLGATLTAANKPAAPPEPNPLKETVATLSEKEKRPAADYARMAEQTITFGSNPESVSRLNASAKDTQDPQGAWRNLVGDALAGVDEGEKLDPKAADWPDLREKLKKMQPPPPPPSQSSKKDKKDPTKDKKQQQKGSGKDKKQPQPSGGGGQSDQQDEGGKGEEGKGESQQPPAQGKSGKGEKPDGQQDGESEKSGKGGDQQEQPSSKGKDPNQIRDFSNSKDGEGQMKDRGRNEEMKGMEDEKAGFGKLGQEKKEGKEQQGVAAAQTAEEEQRSEAPPGMRVVGGGSGQKANDKTSDPVTLEAISRLDQVKQSDSPAILQQRLQPQDQRPQPSSLGKPW